MLVQRLIGLRVAHMLRIRNHDLPVERRRWSIALPNRTPDPTRLPQPGWRLIGFASIGLGTGLFNADVPLAVLAAALVPGLIALAVIAARATLSPPITQRTRPASGEIARRR